MTISFPENVLLSLVHYDARAHLISSAQQSIVLGGYMPKYRQKALESLPLGD